MRALVRVLPDGLATVTAAEIDLPEVRLRTSGACELILNSSSRGLTGISARPRARAGPGTWLPVAAEARKHSATAFLDITKAALSGALNSVTSSYRTTRYQELLVTSLIACHMVGSTAPLGLLDPPRSLRPGSLSRSWGGTASPVRAQGTRTRTRPAVCRAPA